MRDAGRLSATIDVLSDFLNRRVPLKTCLNDWGRGARYAGAKDRAWVSGLCLDALRRKNSLAQIMGDDSARALSIGAMHFLWGYSVDDIVELATEEPHGPGALTEAEVKALQREDFGQTGDGPTRGDYPEWLHDELEKQFGSETIGVMAAMAERADIDLRLNTLKVPAEKSLAALASVKGQPAGILTTSARIEARPSNEKSAAITVIPAFNKGWVEVQDLGSQIAAAAAGNIARKQVLDFCAGGGGKTLALAALMGNTGQLHAYDIDARRLKPIYARAKRAGVRNLQVINPATDENLLAAQKGKVDVVFVDAPCSGSGTWRRHPDTKWRLTPQQLAKRSLEQREVLEAAASFVKPGGRLVYVTCSILRAENQDQVHWFAEGHTEFSIVPAIDSIEASGLLDPDESAKLSACVTKEGFIALTPDKIRADGFFVAVLERKA